MQTNQLDESSQNQKIFIETEEQYFNVPNKTRYYYNCKVCGKESSTIKYNCQRDIIRQKQLICANCQRKRSNRSKFGTDWATQNKEVRRQVMDTLKERYGVINPSQLLEVQEAIKATNLRKYGVEHHLQNKSILEKQQKTNIEKYGVDNVSKLKEVKQKKSLKSKEKFGTDWVTQSEYFKKEYKKVCLEKYGVEHATQNKDIRDKVKSTTIKRYGVEHYSQTMDFAKYHRKMFRFNDVDFDSSWELAFYVYHLNNGDTIIRQPCKFEYTYNSKTYFYFPDFEVNGKTYEIKGSQFFKDDGTMFNPYLHTQDGKFEAKHQCALQHGVIFITKSEIKPYLKYMQTTYGNKWQSKFRI